MVEDTLQNQKYIEALKTLEKHGKTAEHHKKAEHPKEVDFMRDVNKEVSKVVLSMPYKNGQYETIFKQKTIYDFI